MLRFGRDILPILSTSCYACHGPDKAERKANLRFDIEADAKAEHDNGTPIVAEKPDESTLIQRIASTDPEVMMPPPDSHKDLEETCEDDPDESHLPAVIRSHIRTAYD